MISLGDSRSELGPASLLIYVQRAAPGDECPLGGIDTLRNTVVAARARHEGYYCKERQGEQG